MFVREDKENYTVVGTDIKAIKAQARKSGLSYNEAKAWIAQTTGGRGTHIYSDTDTATVKEQNDTSSAVKNDHKG